MYNTRKYQPQIVDETLLLENNFSNKIDEIHNLLDSAPTTLDVNNMGPQFDVYFSSTRGNTPFFIQPCPNPREFDSQSQYSFSNTSSSNSSSAYLDSKRYTRDKGNFKKYPLRSDKSFTVVPNLVETDASTENISLKALSIGPDFYYKSDCQTIIDKMKTTVNYLQTLTADRELLELLVRTFNTNNQMPLYQTKQNTPGEGYNIKMFYYRVINLLESEFLALGKISALLAYMSQNVLAKLITDPKICKITRHEENDFGEILKDYLNAMNNLKKLNNLRIIMADNFRQTAAEDDKKQVIGALDDMIFAIRQWHIMLWTIKEGICAIEITSPEQIEYFRNFFIGS